MSPERLNPDQFGLEDSRPTKESDCYALGMVILEVLSGQLPFKEDSNNYIVTQKVLEGKHPRRPRGAEEAWFTSNLWGMLEECWSWQKKDRPTVEGVYEHLERVWTTWQPLPLSADSDVEADSDNDSWLTTSSPGIFPYYITSLRLLMGSSTAGSPTQEFSNMITAERTDENWVSSSQAGLSRSSEGLDPEEPGRIISGVGWRIFLASSDINLAPC